MAEELVLIDELWLQPTRIYGSLVCRLPGELAQPDPATVGFVHGPDGKLVQDWPEITEGLVLRSVADLGTGPQRAFLAARGALPRDGLSCVIEYRYADPARTVDVASRRSVFFEAPVEQGSGLIAPGGHRLAPLALVTDAAADAQPFFDVEFALPGQHDWLTRSGLLGLDGSRPGASAPFMIETGDVVSSRQTLFRIRIVPQQQNDRIVRCALMMKFSPRLLADSPLQFELTPIDFRQRRHWFDARLGDQKHLIRTELSRNLPDENATIRCWDLLLPTGVEIDVFPPLSGWAREDQAISGGSGPGIQPLVSLDIFPPGHVEDPKAYPVAFAPTLIRPALPPFVDKPLSVIALDVGSSTIAAAVIRGISRTVDRFSASRDNKERAWSAQQIEDVKLGALIDAHLKDTGRQDFGNELFIPSAARFAGEGQPERTSDSWTVSQGLDPACRGIAQAGDHTDRSAEAARNRVKATGKALEASVPLLSTIVEDAYRQGGSGPHKDIVLVRGAEAGIVTCVANDPKTMLCRARSIHEDARSRLVASVDLEQVTPAAAFGCVLDEVVTVLLPAARSSSGEILGREWFLPLQPRDTGEVVLAIAHPASIGGRAVKAYREAANYVIGRMIPDELRLPGLDLRQYSVELVPEAIAIAEALRLALAPGDQPLGVTALPMAFSDAARTATSPPGPNRLLVIDIGHGTSDICVVQCDGPEATCSWPLRSFAMPIAGRSFQEWIARDVEALWEAQFGDAAFPWGGGQGFSLPVRVDDALRRRTSEDDDLLVRVDASDIGPGRTARQAGLAMAAFDATPSASVTPVRDDAFDTVWARLRCERDGALPFLAAGLDRFAEMIRKQVASLLPGATTLLALTGRGSRSPGVAAALARAFQSDPVTLIDAADILSQGTADVAFRATALKQAVARGTAMVARDRALARRMDSSLPERGHFAIVFGELDDLGRFTRLSSLQPMFPGVATNLGGVETRTYAAPMDKASADRTCYLVRMIGPLTAGDLPLLSGDMPDHARAFAIRDVEQASLAPIVSIALRQPSLILRFEPASAANAEGQGSASAAIRISLDPDNATWVDHSDKYLDLTDEGCFV
jgi:hypothetical protein